MNNNDGTTSSHAAPTDNDNTAIDTSISTTSRIAIVEGEEQGKQQNNEHTEVDAIILKRRAIQKIRNDTSIDELTKRLKIQQLMDGSSSNRLTTTNSTTTTASTTISNAMSVDSTSSTGIGASVGVSVGIGVNIGSFVANNVHVMKCVHYEERKCNIVAPCCGQIYGCRVCHDEMVTDGHEVNRFQVTEVVCKECHTRQERSNKCIKCNITFGEYHCNICNLWMNTTKEPFHCNKCGMCRVGGQQHFKHCDSCAMCIRESTFDNHTCFKDKFKNSCPVCREDMHTSRHASMDLKCGHAIHSHCFRKLASFDYRVSLLLFY